MQSALYVIAYPSLCVSVKWVNQSKWLKLASCNFHHRVAQSLWFLCFKVLSRNSDRFPLSGGIKQGWGVENKLFSSFMPCASISRKWHEARKKLLLMTSRKLHMRFRLAPSSITFDDLELVYIQIFSEFCATLT